MADLYTKCQPPYVVATRNVSLPPRVARAAALRPGSRAISPPLPSPYRSVKSVASDTLRHASAINSAVRSRSSSDTISLGECM